MEDTVDSAFGGEVRVVQPRKGYRFSVEAVVLARYGALRGGDSILDLGCGSGIVGFCLLNLLPQARLLGLDLFSQHIERARLGAALNGWEARTRFEVCDVRNVQGFLKRSSVDLVVSNPPFRSPGSSQVSADEVLAIARNELRGSLKDFMVAAQYALKSKGSFCSVFPAERLDYLLECARTSGLQPAGLRFIYPRVGESASFVLLHAVKGGRGTLNVESPLYLHNIEGYEEKYSAEAQRLIGPCRA